MTVNHTLVVRPVKVIRLIGRDTVEEVVLRRAEAKLKLTHDVIEGGQFSLADNQALIAENSMQVRTVVVFAVFTLFP